MKLWQVMRQGVLIFGITWVVLMSLSIWFKSTPLCLISFIFCGLMVICGYWKQLKYGDMK